MSERPTVEDLDNAIRAFGLGNEETKQSILTAIRKKDEELSLLRGKLDLAVDILNKSHWHICAMMAQDTSVDLDIQVLIDIEKSISELRGEEKP